MTRKSGNNQVNPSPQVLDLAPSKCVRRARRLNRRAWRRHRRKWQDPTMDPGRGDEYRLRDVSDVKRVWFFGLQRWKWRGKKSPATLGPTYRVMATEGEKLVAMDEYGTSQYSIFDVIESNGRPTEPVYKVVVRRKRCKHGGLWKRLPKHHHKSYCCKETGQPMSLCSEAEWTDQPINRVQATITDDLQLFDHLIEPRYESNVIFSHRDVNSAGLTAFNGDHLVGNGMLPYYNRRPTFDPNDEEDEDGEDEDEDEEEEDDDGGGNDENENGMGGAVDMELDVEGGEAAVDGAGQDGGDDMELDPAGIG